MAEWKSVSRSSDFVLKSEEEEEEDHTFDLSCKDGNMNYYCVVCRTMAKMSSNPSAGSNSNLKGGCQTSGCPGYTGHPPIPRVSGKHNTLEDDSSDDIPLLFATTTTTTNMHNGDDHSSEELGPFDHCHTSMPSRGQAAKAKKKLMAACCLCLVFIVGEVIGGYLSGSLAIMSDAAHMFSDFASFCVSLLAIWMGQRKPTRNYTFGYYRAEALGALFTVMIIWYVTGVLLYLAGHRLQTGEFTVDPNPMMVVAGCAVAFNIILGTVLHGVCKLPHGHSHGHGGGHSHGHRHVHIDEDPEEFEARREEREHINIRAALIHVLGDLIQSIGVLISSVIIKIWPEYKKADPVCTVLFSVIVFCTTVTILRDTVKILLEAHPKDLDYEEIRSDLLSVKHVAKVHDLHVWSLTTDRIALSCHLAVVNCEGLNESWKEMVLQEATKVVRNKHGINMTTVQVEDYNAHVMNNCEQCSDILH